MLYLPMSLILRRLLRVGTSREAKNRFSMPIRRLLCALVLKRQNLFLRKTCLRRLPMRCKIAHPLGPYARLSVSTCRRGPSVVCSAHPRRISLCKGGVHAAGNRCPIGSHAPHSRHEFFARQP